MLAEFQDFERYVSRFTNYERLKSFSYDHRTLGLDRIRAFLAEIGSPEKSFPTVHIAGTKGKGSTSLILEALLLEEGKSVGTYTSPHVEHLRERIRIDGCLAAKEALLAEMNAVLPILERRRSQGSAHFPSFFELMTALAMAVFKTHGVDWGIFEVGLGGRLDATNVLTPRWTAITSISLEHTLQLGNTVQKIAREKAGIIKPGVPIVMGALPPAAAEEVVAIARESSAPVIQADTGGVTFAGRGKLQARGYGVLPAGPIAGPGLRADFAIALRIFERILAEEGKVPGQTTIASALLGLALPARVEVFRGTPPIVIDAAHTVESLRALRLTLEEIEFPRPRTLIFSISSGKELAAILREVPGIAETILLTLSDSVRSVPPTVLRDKLGAGEVIPSPEDAFEQAIARGNAVVATGSFYLAGKLRPLAVRRPQPSTAR
ncbi:MAG TPA: hypothetical protein VMT52_16885 [Planctomycetota bacterium]|nr:hypothetical protein [Planctomycetota bacterium]